MGLITLYHTFTDSQDAGGALTAANVNTNWQRLYTLVNGNIDQDNIASTYFLTRSGTKPTWAAGYEGQLWYDTDDHKVYVANNSAWVPGIGHTGAQGATGPTGHTGAQGPGSNIRAYTWIISYPATGRIPGPELQEAHTVTRVFARTITGGTGTCTVALNIDARSSATGATGNYIMPGDLTATPNGVGYTGNTGGHTGQWDDPSLEDKMVLDVVITTVIGNPKYVAITLSCEV